MNYGKIRILFVLLAVLAALYAVNIFFTKSVSDALIGTPAKVSFMIMEPPADKCGNCFDAERVVSMIDAAHDIKYKTSNIRYDSVLSQKYIEKYGIKNLPAIVVSGDIEDEKVTSAWSALSGEKINGRIVIENLLPYYDIESGKVKGVLSVVLIKDETCENCFDENEYINALGRFGMVVGNTEVYDVASAEGGALVKKYAIVKVPALILSPDAGDYSGFASSWGEVGTVEKDGWFIFREVQKLSPEYKSI